MAGDRMVKKVMKAQSGGYMSVARARKSLRTTRIRVICSVQWMQ